MPDLYVVLNPAADRGRAARAASLIERELRNAGARYELVRTEAARHAELLAERAARAGWGGVVAVGGDGIVHEVANGLMRAAAGRPTVPMGVVPVGSGNDFARLLGVPARDPRAAMRMILSSPPRRVDVGRVVSCIAERAPESEWWFTNGIGLGFDAQVAEAASRSRRARRTAIYAVAVARTLRHLATPHMRITVDGRTVADGPLTLATIANGARHGGSFWLTPDARIDDGLLDVLVAGPRTALQILPLIPKVLRGTHLAEPQVDLVRGRAVEVAGDAPLPMHADGELVASGVREMRVEVEPGGLNVLA